MKLVEMVRRNSQFPLELWAGCIAGALAESDDRAKRSAAGLTEVYVEPTRIYTLEDTKEFLAAEGIDVAAVAPEVDGKFMSAFIRVRKPQG